MENTPLTPRQLSDLRNYGFVALDPLKFSSLINSFAALFDVSKEYFALESENDAKRRYRAPSGSGASEEGFSVVPTEKQIFTCRSYPRTPALISDKAKDVWQGTGDMLQRVMGMISEDLDLPKNPYSPLLGQCLKFEKSRTPTLLRLFRYDRPHKEGLVGEGLEMTETSRIVAERHKDLGLLSIVVGSSPGLEVYNESTSEWTSIEERHGIPAGASGLTITLLSGQVLRYLSRGQYRAGVHRVRCSSMTNSDGNSEPFRYSIVYALRPYPSLLNLSEFESPATGTFTQQERDGVDGKSAQVLFNKVCGQHFNINIGQHIREEQRRATAAEKTALPSLFTSTTDPRDPRVLQSNGVVGPKTPLQNDITTNTKMNRAEGRWRRLKNQLTRTFTTSGRNLAQASA